MRFREEATIKTVTETEDFSHSSVFKCISASFQQVLNVHPNLFAEKHYLFAGRRARIRVVGKRLAEYIFLPFSHLQTNLLNSDKSQLTIDLQDESETGISCPVKSLSDASMPYRTITASPDSRFLMEQDANAFLLFDRKTQRIIGSFTSADQFVDRSKPLNRLLALWYKDRGIPVIHAGLVAYQDQGLLIAAGSRGGKSTSTMACLNSGFDFLGDDQIGFEETPDGSFLGHSLYSSVRLYPDQLNNLFPQFLNEAYIDYLHDNKAVIFLSEIRPHLLRSAAPIRVLVLSHIADVPNSRFFHVTKAKALSLITSSSIPTMLGFDANDMERIAQLVKQVPVYRLEMGKRVNEIPPLMRQLVKEVL